jgi:hypothetical protein
LAKRSIKVRFRPEADMGSNSGSPVLDAHGRLIGLDFDSYREAVSASWWFDQRYERAIHVDLRYMRWLMERKT